MLEQLEPEDMKKEEEAISCCLGMSYTLDEKQETFVESNVVTEEANKVQLHDIKQEEGNSKEINKLIKLLRESYLKEDKTKQKKILEFMLRNKDVYNKTIQQEHLFILVFLPYLYNWDHKVMADGYASIRPLSQYINKENTTLIIDIGMKTMDVILELAIIKRLILHSMTLIRCYKRR